MSVSYFVRYQGRAADETAFIDYYVTQHAAVLVRFPRIRSLTLHRPVEWSDPFPVNPEGTRLLAQMTFDSPAALNAALASEARSQARDDFANFPRFDGTVTHQAMSSRIIF
jgi:uncharacterized protein (TIGR02118 family)